MGRIRIFGNFQNKIENKNVSKYYNNLYNKMFSKLTVKELKQQCKLLGLKKYSRMVKNDLIKLLNKRHSEIQEEKYSKSINDTLDILTDLVKEKGIAKNILEMKQSIEKEEERQRVIRQFIESGEHFNYTIDVIRADRTKVNFYEKLNFNFYEWSIDNEEQVIQTLITSGIDIEKEVYNYVIATGSMQFYSCRGNIIFEIKKDIITFRDVIETLGEHIRNYPDPLCLEEIEIMTSHFAKLHLSS